MPDDEMCYWPTTDSALFRWMEAHPAGFVLNIERGPRAAYMVLHRSRCPHIAALASDAPGGFTQRD